MIFADERLQSLGSHEIILTRGLILFFFKLAWLWYFKTKHFLSCLEDDIKEVDAKTSNLLVK